MANSARGNILDKVRALLNKTCANGCTKHEEHAALTKARAMMDAYEITEAELKKPSGMNKYWEWRSEEVKKTWAKKPERTKKGRSGPSPTVVAWQAQGPLPPHGVITVLPPHNKINPKRGKAGERFAFYKEGMKVIEYLEIMERHGRTRKETQGDIRWDVTKGFIRVVT
jgi:Protein of unknown function (DUF2786)